MKKLRIFLAATAVAAATFAFSACGPMTDICLHELTTVDAVAATCEVEGTKAYEVCTLCNLKFINDEEVTADDLVVPALGHDMQAGDDAANYFDAEKHFAKSVSCTREGCARTETYDAIKIGSTELFKTLAEDIARGSNIGCDTIEFTADIDMTGEAFVSLEKSFNGSSINFKGNGHKIVGLCAPLYKALPSDNATFSDLTLEGSSFDTSLTDTSNQGYGAFVGYLNNNVDVGSTVSFENCKVKDCSIKAYKYAAGFVGFASSPNGTVKFDNCELIDSSVVTVDSSCGGFIGHTYSQVEIKDCKVLGTSSIGCEEDRGGDTAKAGQFIGTVSDGVVTIDNANVDSTVTLSNVNAEEAQTNGLVGRITSIGRVVTGEDVWTTHTALKNMLASGTADVTLQYDYHLVETSAEIKVAHAVVFFGSSQCTNWSLNGNGHTIYGLTRPLISVETGATISISDLTIANADIASTAAQSHGLGVGAFIGYMDAQANLTMNNCKLLNSKVEGLEGGARAGGLVGYVSCGVDVASAVTIKDCEVKDSTIISADGASGIINCTYAETTNIIDCKVLGNTTITSTEERNGEGKAHTAVFVGTVQATSTTTITGAMVDSTVVVNRAGTAEPVHNLVGRKLGTLIIDETNI